MYFSKANTCKDIMKLVKFGMIFPKDMNLYFNEEIFNQEKICLHPY